jgi:aryl-alcohol dehydrogenase-like predicted oxidoreductase
MSHVDVDTAIVGTTNPNHLLENVEAVLKGPLTPNVYNEVKRRTKEVGIEVL